jgi:O-acetylhomoserine/O-acetylserine sulfhydrylase-like pyridoxal-dependent enzyme
VKQRLFVFRHPERIKKNTLLRYFLPAVLPTILQKKWERHFADDSLDVNIYSRFSNPTVDDVIDKVAMLEGADDGVATGTGMAAIFSTFMTFLNKGDHIISASAVFGSTHTILTKYLPKWGIEHSYFDMNKPEALRH